MKFLFTECPQIKDRVNEANVKGTALHYIARNGECDAVQRLLRNGAKADILNATMNSAIMEATFNPSFDQFRSNVLTLLPVSPMVRNKDGKTLIDLVLDASTDQIDYIVLHRVRDFERCHAIRILEECLRQFTKDPTEIPTTISQHVKRHIDDFEDQPKSEGLNIGLVVDEADGYFYCDQDEDNYYSDVEPGYQELEDEEQLPGNIHLFLNGQRMMGDLNMNMFFQHLGLVAPPPVAVPQHDDADNEQADKEVDGIGSDEIQLVEEPVVNEEPKSREENFFDFPSSGDES